MSSFILMGLCLGIGLLFQHIKSLPKDAHIAINSIILYVAVPSLVILSIPQIEWSPNLLSLCLGPWIIWIGAFLFFNFVGKKLNWDKSVIGCLILTAGLGNTGFVGYPVVEALFGKEGLKHAILFDQPGTFVIVSSVGVWVASHYSSNALSLQQMVRRVFLFPPFIAFLLAIVLTLIGWTAQGDLKIVLEKLSAILTPLALISVGLQLKWSAIHKEKIYLTVGLGYKLFIAPMLIFLFYKNMNFPREVFQVAVIESAMAPMIVGSILAASHNLNSRLAGMMIGVGVPVSFFSIALWYLFLNFFK